MPQQTTVRDSRSVMTQQIELRPRRGHTGVPGIDDQLKIAARGKLSEVKKLLGDHIGLLNQKSAGHNRTLLWEASNKGRLEVVKYLIERGADVNIPGRYRRETLILIKPFAAAARKGKAGVADYLRERTEMDCFTEAFLGDIEGLCNLIAAEPSLVHQYQEEDSVWYITPLHAALAGGQASTCQVLLDHGAAVREYGRMLFDFACRLGRLDLVKTLQDAGADIKDADVFSVLYPDDRALADFFFSQGLDPNKPGTATGQAPLIYVCRGDKGEHCIRVRALLDYGADVNGIDNKGNTALHVAARAGFVASMKLLIDAGADVGTRNKNGKTALELAMRNKRQGILRLIG